MAKLQPFVHQAPHVGRNMPCPCGSGKKFKVCHGKQQATPSGNSYGYRKRRLPYPKMLPAVSSQPGDGFDSDIGAVVARTLRESGVAEADIRGFLRAGILITEQDRELLPASVVQAWDEAVAEYNQAKEEKDDADTARTEGAPVHEAVEPGLSDEAGSPGPGDTEVAGSADPGGGA